MAFGSPVRIDPDSYSEIQSDDLASLALYERLRDETHAFRHLAAASLPIASAPLGEDPEAVSAVFVTCNYFEVYRAVPIEGRLLQPSDCANAEPVAVMGEALWRARFGANPGVVGDTLLYGDTPVTIVGVVGPYRSRSGNNRLLMPAPVVSQFAITEIAARMFHGDRNTRDADTPWLRLVGRLEPGVGYGEATAELRVVSGDATMTATNGSQWASGGFPLWAIPLFLVFPSLLTVMTSANVSTLLLSRAAGRQREMAIRLALGTGRGRLVRMLLIEVGLLAAIAVPSSLVLVTTIPDFLYANLVGPSMGGVPPLFGVDWRVVLYLAGAAVLAAVAAGLFPAREALASDLVRSLGGHAGSIAVASRIRRTIVGIQVALGAIPLVAAVMFVQTVSRFDQSESATDQLVVADFGYAEVGQSVLDAVRAIPGARSVALSENIPMTGRSETFQWAGRSRRVYVNTVLPGYFETMGIPLVAGVLPSGIDPSVPFDAEPTVVSETFASDFFPEGFRAGARVSVYQNEFAVVAVVADRPTASKNGGNPRDPVWYRLTVPPVAGRNVLVVRVDGDVGGFASRLRAVLREEVPGAVGVASLAAALDDHAYADHRALGRIFTVLGGVALVLALAGIAGVVAYSTRLRHKEVAIRVALGAAPPELMWLLTASCLRPVPIGLALGLVAAWGGIELLSLLAQVDPLEPAPYLVTILVLVAAVVIPALVSAYNLSMASPLAPLRGD
jgi:predicted permease